MAIPLNTQEIERFSKEPWVRERVGDAGMAWIAKGVVPIRDVDQMPQCVFLDDDELCSMQKKLGHDFLPQTCQSFPFGFVSNEKDQLVAQMSQLCPSIRDGIGDLVTVQRLRDKLSQKGGSERMSKAMATRHGRILTQSQYMRVVHKWLERLERQAPPLELLSELYDWTKAFEDALPGSSEKPDDAGVTEALARADETQLFRFQLSTSLPFQARTLHAYVLGGLSYPSRVALHHRIDPRSAMQSLRVLWTKLKWILCRGSVHVLYIRNPVPLGSVDGVERFLGTEKARPINRLLRLVLERRQIFRDPRFLMEVIIDLALSTIVISRYARCRAASEGRTEVQAADIHEGISIVELALLGHASQRQAGATLRNMRRTLIAARENYLRLLASENTTS